MSPLILILEKRLEARGFERINTRSRHHYRLTRPELSQFWLSSVRDGGGGRAEVVLSRRCPAIGHIEAAVTASVYGCSIGEAEAILDAVLNAVEVPK